MKLKLLAALGGLLIGTGANAQTFTETTDFPNSVDFATGVSVGTVGLTPITITGSLNGSCVATGTGGFDCNSGTGGDTQDSFLFTVPANLRFDRFSLSPTITSAPVGFTYSFSAQNQAGAFFTPGPLPIGSSSKGGIGISGVGTTAFSIFGSSATAAGPFQLNYVVTFQAVTALPEMATWAMMIIGFACVGAALRRQRDRTMSVTAAA